MPLSNSTATESALNPSQSQDFLCEEEVHSDVEQPFYKENLRANYETEEVRLLMISTVHRVLKDVFLKNKKLLLIIWGFWK